MTGPFGRTALLLQRRATNIDSLLQIRPTSIAGRAVYDWITNAECEANKFTTSPTDQILGHTFKVGMEFDICFLSVFLVTLVALTSRRHHPFALFLDFTSSFYLLYTSYNRTFYIRYTEIAQWTKESCTARYVPFVFDYVLVSVVGLMSCAFMEYSSFLRLLKIYGEKVKRFTARFSRISWSQGRRVVLATAIFCTLSSLFLTFILWGAVHKSLGNAALDTSVLVFLTIAAILRLIRQFMEGLTLAIGIASREFKWLNSSTKQSFGCIAFSSFVLLIHSSSITYNFSNQGQKVWGVKQYAIVAGLFVDVLFRLFVCGWAIFNSCCFTKVMLLVVQCSNRCSILGDYISQYFIRLPNQIFYLTRYAYVILIRNFIYAQIILGSARLLSHTLLFTWKVLIICTQLFLLICVNVIRPPNEERQVDIERHPQITFNVETQQEINVDYMLESLVFTPNIVIVQPNISLTDCHSKISSNCVSFMHQEINHDQTREDLVFNHTIFILHRDSLYDREAFVIQINQEQNCDYTREELICPRKVFILRPTTNTSINTAPPRKSTVQQSLYIIRPFLPPHGGENELPSSVLTIQQRHYADPVDIGSPFSLLRLQTRCIEN